MSESKEMQARLGAKELAALRQTYDFGDFGGAGNGGPTLTGEQAEALLRRLFDDYAAMLAERARIERELAERTALDGVHAEVLRQRNAFHEELVDARAHLATVTGERDDDRLRLAEAESRVRAWVKAAESARAQLAEARRERAETVRTAIAHGYEPVDGCGNLNDWLDARMTELAEDATLHDVREAMNALGRPHDRAHAMNTIARFIEQAADYERRVKEVLDVIDAYEWGSVTGEAVIEARRALPEHKGGGQ